MSSFSVSGIASGIDSKSIISQMVSLETQKITKFQQRIALEEAERIAFQDLSSRLQSLKSAVGGFSSSSLFSSLSASSSDEDLVSVSATDAAPRGSHQVKVIQTAQAHRIGGTGVASPISTAIGANVTKTDFGTGTALSAVDAGSKTVQNAELSSFDYNANVTLAGQYSGSENTTISVELLSDVSGPNGTVDLRISTDGVSYETYTGVSVTAGKINLDSSTYFDNNGLSLTIDNADNTMKDGDLVEFRARAKASIEYTVGNGERKEITIESDETLAEMVKKINDDPDSGLRADILNDGSASNPYRLLLTSLTEGSAGEIDILSNTSVINLDGVTAEDPVSNSTSYTGEVSLEGTLSKGAGNNNIVIEMMSGGSLGTASFKISADGGFTFHDNNGSGFTLTGPGGDGKYSFDLDSVLKDDGTALFDSALDIDLKLSADGSSFTQGDRITVDLFDAEIQAAQDALVNVDGITLVKTSNTVSDVFDGLTLNLNNADPNKTVNVNVTENVGDVAAVMEGFVEAYNSAMSLIHANSKYNPDEDSEAPLLMGDSMVRQIQSSMQRMITSRLSHLDTGLNSLADLGIQTDSKTGQLSFDSSELSKALSDDPNGVRRLLNSFGENLSGSDAFFKSSTSATQAGVYNVKVTQARSQATVNGLSAAKDITVAERLTIRINSDAQGTGSIQPLVVDLGIGLTAEQQVQAIQNEFDSRDLMVTASLVDGKIMIRHNEYGDDYEIEVTSDQSTGDSGFTSVTQSGLGSDLKGTINGISADAIGDTLVGKKGYSSEGLVIQVSNDFVGDAGKISVSEGLGSSFTKVLDSFIGFDGLLNNKIDSFDSQISRFEEQMNRVTERATKLEDRLRQQFVNLEVTLGHLNSTGEYLLAQLQSLPTLQIKR